MLSTKALCSVATVIGTLSCVAQGASAQTAPAAAEGVTDSGTIVVTGTRASNRTVADSLSPIQVLGGEALGHTGKLGLQEVLSNVLPSFDLPSQAGGDLSNIVRVATLRGLNPDQTLILVNGKRRHPGSIVNVAGTVGVGSQGTDLNLIPSSAIAHVEVLTDGAAAQYGSDAIAGVINIILKNNYAGGSMNGQIGQYYKGDGENGQIALNWGFGTDKDNFLSLSASYIRQANTDRAVDATISPLYYAGDPRNDQPAGKRQYGYGIPKSAVASIAYNLSKELTDGINLYSFGTYAKQRAKQWQGYRAPNNSNNVIALYPDGFQPKTEVRQTDYQIVGGFKGENLAGWSWDLSTSYGENEGDTWVFDSVNSTYGTASPTTFYAGRLTSWQWVSNLDLSKAYDIGLAKPLTVAVGAEYKRDGYKIGAGQVESYARGPSPILTGPNAGKYTNTPGAQAFPGFRPADVSANHRNNVGTYVDLETSILANWDVGIAGRYEHYSDFGSNVSGKFSTRYQVVPWLAVRGTVSNGFRAPSVGQQYYSSTATSQYQGVDYNIALKPVSSPVAQALGARPLKAERSFNLGAGLVLNPFRHFTLTADAYQIQIDNRIVLSANLGLLPSGALNPAVTALLASQGLDGVNVVRYFLNGANTRTRGVDIVGTYANDFGGWGHLSITGAVNFNRTKVRSLTDQASTTVYGTTVFSNYARDQLTLSTPRNKEILTVNWDVGKFGLMVRESRFGHYIQPSTVTGGYSYASPEFTTDLEVNYKVTSNIEVGVGAQNLFDNYPDKANAKNFAASTFNGANIYNAATPFGLSGGNYYARVGITW